VVLLGCLNLAGLAMARTFQRSAELSTRRALGASRVRLFSQLILEVLLLSGLAGLAGLGAASLTIDTLTGMLPPETPGLDKVGLAPPVLLFAGGVALLAGFVVGTIPSLFGAWAGAHPRPLRTATTDGARRRTQSVLVIGQVAVATLLVVGAILLGRSLRNLQAVPLGYDLEHVLTFHVQLPSDAYPDVDARRAYLASAEDALRGISGVSAVGASTFLPRQEGLTVGLRLVPVGESRDDAPSATWIQVTPGYFEAMGMQLLQGVPFPGAGADRWDQVVITETLARQLFEDGDAVGARADIDGGTRSTPTTIGAVVSDIHLRGRQADPTRIVYSSLEASPRAGMGFAVRAAGSPSTLVARVREAALSVDSSVPPYDVTTTGQAAGREIAAERAIAILSRLFSVSALLLTALGLYGVVAQGIAERRRELGIRIVLGAESRRLVQEVLFRPIALTILGLGVGAIAAAWMATLLSPLLFEVSPREPAVFTVVAVGLLAVISLAAYAPARRIVQIDPAESLRAE
jgi:putative ABC transport system permease protein